LVEATRAEGVETREGENGRGEGEETMRTFEGGLEKESFISQLFFWGLFVSMRWRLLAAHL